MAQKVGLTNSVFCDIHKKFLNILKALSLLRMPVKSLDLLPMSGKECIQRTHISI